ncbi:MAG: energy transducer TonB [bacterium]
MKSHILVITALLLIATCLFLVAGCSEQHEPVADYKLSAADFAGIDWLTADIDSLQSAWQSCCPDKLEAVWPSTVNNARRVDEAPHLLQMPTPKYPLKARAMQASGIVRVNILVGSDSTIWAVTIQRGSGLNLGFEEQALKAALSSQWTAAIRGGQPTWAWVAYPFHFSQS